MIALLIRAVTLEGASKGILFFLTPQWHELSNPKVSPCLTYIFWLEMLCVFDFVLLNPFDVVKTCYHDSNSRNLCLSACISSSISRYDLVERNKLIHRFSTQSRPRSYSRIALQIWSEAIQQSFFSLTVGLCPITTLSSYNKFRRPIYRWVYSSEPHCSKYQSHALPYQLSPSPTHFHSSAQRANLITVNILTSKPNNKCFQLVDVAKA